MPAWPTRYRTARARNARFPRTPSATCGAPSSPPAADLVGGEVVLAAEPVVVDAGYVRDADVDVRRRAFPVSGHRPRTSHWLLTPLPSPAVRHGPSTPRDSLPTGPNGRRLPDGAYPAPASAAGPHSGGSGAAGSGRRASSVSSICWPYLASLFSPTPLTVPSSARVAGQPRRDLAQRRVVEDHVRRHALLLRGRRPPGAEPLEAPAAASAGRSAAAAAAAGRRARAARGGRSGSRRSRTWSLAAQHRGARVGQHQRAVVALDGQQALGQQLAHDAAPLRLAQLGRRRRTRVRASWSMLDDLRGLLAEQDVDRPGPRRTAGAARAAAGTRSTGASARRPCRPTTPAASGTCRSCRTAAALLAEVGQQLHAPALDRLAQRQHGVEMAAQPAAVRLVALGGVDHLALLHDVLAGRTPARRWTGSPSRPARPVSW